MTDFEKRVNEYMQCDKKTLAELLALRDLQFPPYQPIPNTPYVGDPPIYPWNPNGQWWPIIWYETNTQYIN